MVKVFPTFSKDRKFFSTFSKTTTSHYYHASMTGTTCKCGCVGTLAHFNFGTLISSPMSSLKFSIPSLAKLHTEVKKKCPWGLSSRENFILLFKDLPSLPPHWYWTMSSLNTLNSVNQNVLRCQHSHIYKLCQLLRHGNSVKSQSLKMWEKLLLHLTNGLESAYLLIFIIV